MQIVSFPTRAASAPRVPRLIQDAQRLKEWYDAQDWNKQDAWYTLHELRAATGIPLTRLPTVLYRHGWITERKRGYPLVFWHGPSGSDPLKGP